MLYMENNEQRGTRIDNRSEWSNGTARFDRTGPTEKSGPPRKVDRFFRNFSGWTEPIHSVLNRKFRKFWLNGSRPRLRYFIYKLFTISWPVEIKKAASAHMFWHNLYWWWASVLFVWWKKTHTSGHQNRAAIHSSAKGDMKWTQIRQMSHITYMCVLASDEVGRENGHLSRLTLTRANLSKQNHHHVEIYSQFWYLAQRLWRITRSCIKRKGCLFYSSNKAKRWVRILIHQIWC